MLKLAKTNIFFAKTCPKMLKLAKTCKILSRTLISISFRMVGQCEALPNSYTSLLFLFFLSSDYMDSNISNELVKASSLLQVLYDENLLRKGIMTLKALLPFSLKGTWSFWL